MSKNISIYIHIPFCNSKCHYCDFVSYENKNEYIEKYVDALCSEILQNAELLSQYNINTIYFGGGTPSYIDSKYIVKIMSILALFIKDINAVEITIEVNPNSVNIDKINEYKNCGINRISIGLQSTHNDVLKTIGRAHNYVDFLNALDICKKVGINNISVDLIYPLPNMSVDMLKESLNKIINLSGIKHISIYNLEVHESTKIHFLIAERYVSMVSEDDEYKMKELIDDTLQKNNFRHYEISNYAINGFESRHNLSYWNQHEYLGFGAGAASFFTGSRYKNTGNIEVYINNILNNTPIAIEKEDLDKLALMKEYIILKLRLEFGLNINDFKKKFSTDIFSLFNSEINKLKKDNLIIVDEKQSLIYLTKRGKEVANYVWEKFI